MILWVVFSKFFSSLKYDEIQGINARHQVTGCETRSQILRIQDSTTDEITYMSLGVGEECRAPEQDRGA